MLNFMDEEKNKRSNFSISGAIIFFIIIILVAAALGVKYNSDLYPSHEKIEELMKKFQRGDYTIPYFVAERYLTWLGMRTNFFMLHYTFILGSVTASLTTVFFASKEIDELVTDTNELKRKQIDKKRDIVILSLLATIFTVAEIFVDPSRQALLAQHAWRQLDSCIMATVVELDIEAREKDRIIVEKLKEMEDYIGLLER